MRADRLLTLNFVRPFRRALSLLAVHRPSPIANVPILMYHAISDEREADVLAYFQTTTTPAAFALQMKVLRRLGYRGVSLREGLELFNRHDDPSRVQSSLSGGESGPARCKCVVLTFDDGFQDFYTSAIPVLKQYGFTATVFLPTAYLGDTAGRFRREPSAMPRAFLQKKFLTWDQVRELHQYGIEFGSHTVSHSKLVELSWKEIQSELQDSKLEIELRLGAKVQAFAYPFAFPQSDQSFVRRFKRLLAEVGYTSCVTTEVGRVSAGSDRYRLKRLPVNSLDDSALLQAKLDGSYDWIALPQAMVKMAKAWCRSRAKRNDLPAQSASIALN
jgi:peptidoglycan/xylan/chitin deacetylase (PgdA/CDA1 family)